MAGTGETPEGVLSAGWRSTEPQHSARSGAGYLVSSKNNFGFAQSVFASLTQTVCHPLREQRRQVPWCGKVSAFPELDTSLLPRACVSAHTYHIGFLSPEHQVFAANVCGGVSPPNNPHPQQHQACAVQGFVKPFSIN